MILKYINSENRGFDLLGANFRLKDGNFHDFSWDYDSEELQHKEIIKRFRKSAKEFELEFEVRGSVDTRKRMLDELFEAMETDILNKTPGKIWWNEFYIEIFCIASNTYPDEKKNITKKVVRLIAPSSFWCREKQYSFGMQQVYSSNNKRYPYKYPYRYANGLNNTYIINENFVPSNFRLIIYGPVINPMVVIGDNSYLVNIVLESGERLEIDSREETIVKVMKYGEGINAFHNRQKRRKFFEKIPHGRQPIYWTGKFPFDLILYEERSEPKWNRL